MNNLANINPIRCPRCGYDQRGTVASWRESCPLTGICTECGLEFPWSELLVPTKFQPQWCVEFVPRRRRIFRACATTFLHSFRPHEFWSRLKMSQPIRPWRLAVYAAWLMLPLLVTYVGVQGTIAAIVRYRVQQDVPARQQQLLAQIGSLRQFLQTGQFTQNLQNYSAETRQSAVNQVKRQLAAMLAQAARSPIIEQSYLGAMLEAVLFPVARSSWGKIRWPDGTIDSYPAPSALFECLSAPPTFSAYPRAMGSNLTGEEPYYHALASLLCALLLLIVLPASFILLPASRRRAKVRWAHIGRIMVYSLFILSLLSVIEIGAGFWAALKPNPISFSALQHSALMAWIALPLWWAVAIKNYLKMPHAAAVAILLTLMLALLFSPCLAYILPEWIVRLVLG